MPAGRLGPDDRARDNRAPGRRLHAAPICVTDEPGRSARISGIHAWCRSGAAGAAGTCALAQAADIPKFAAACAYAIQALDRRTVAIGLSAVVLALCWAQWRALLQGRGQAAVMPQYAARSGKARVTAAVRLETWSRV